MAGPTLWVCLWLVAWAAPATLVNLGMVRRHGAAWWWVIAGCVFGWAGSLALFLCIRWRGAKAATGPASAPAAAATRTEWTTVGRWAGWATQTTPVFTVAGHRWRLHWRTSGEQQILGGMMQLLLYRGEGTPVLNAFLPNTTQPGHGSVVLPEGPGRFFLRINSVGFRWDIHIEEERSYPAAGPGRG